MRHPDLGKREKLRHKITYIRLTKCMTMETAYTKSNFVRDVHPLGCLLSRVFPNLKGGSLRKQPSFFAPGPSGVSRETTLGPGAKKDGCFRRLERRPIMGVL